MTEVQQKPALAGALGTIAVWILIFLFFYFGASLFAPKPFKTIKIRLDAPQKVESTKKVESGKLKTESSQPQKTESTQTQKNVAQGEVSPSASSKESATPSAGTPRNAPSSPASEKKNVKKPEAKKPSKPQTQTQKAQDKQSKIIEPPLAPDLSDGVDFAKKNKSISDKDFDAMFNNDNVTENKSTDRKPDLPVVNPIDNNPFGKETVAKVGDNDTSMKSESDNKKRLGEISNDTTKGLKDIENAKKFESDGGEISIKADAVSDGKYAIETTDGRKRELISPAVPELDLTPNAQNEAVKYPAGPYSLSFTIRKDGTVDPGSIKVPNSLPMIIQRELKDKLCTWQFSPTDYLGYVEFNYSMKRR